MKTQPGQMAALIAGTMTAADAVHGRVNSGIKRTVSKIENSLGQVSRLATNVTLFERPDFPEQFRYSTPNWEISEGLFSRSCSRVVSDRPLVRAAHRGRISGQTGIFDGWWKQPLMTFG